MEITTAEFRHRFKNLAAEFAAVSDIDVLLQNCSLSIVPSGTRIIDYQGTCSTLYLVWSGLLTASIEDGGTKLVIGDIRPGEWVGEVTLIEPGPATASVSCVEESQLLALSHEKFNTLRVSHPRAASALLHALSLNIAERLRTTSERVIEQIGSSEYRLQDMPPEEKTTAVKKITKLLRLLFGISGDK
jgi:CRP/FNR family transcriptional regulator, cyclic AMP receptor protein